MALEEEGLFSPKGFRTRQKPPVGGSVFLFGFLGAVSGLIVLYVAVLSHVIPSQDHERASRYRNKPWLEIDRAYGIVKTGELSYSMVIGRFVFFVCGVTLLFTYVGKQLYRWILFGCGMTLMVNTGIGANIINGHASVIMASIGWSLVVWSVILLDSGFDRRSAVAAKCLTIITATLVSTAYPVGILAIHHKGSFLPCLVMLALSPVFALIVVVFVAHRSRESLRTRMVRSSRGFISPHMLSPSKDDFASDPLLPSQQATPPDDIT